MIDKVVEKGKIFLTLAWASATSSWLMPEKILAVIATIAAIVASVITSIYYYRENKRREKKIKMEREWHNKRMYE